LALELLNEYQFGDMTVRYVRDTDTFDLGLVLLPSSMASRLMDKHYRVDSLAQIKLIGDGYPSAYGHGHTMRNSESVSAMTFLGQSLTKGPNSTTVVTSWRHPHPCLIENHVTWDHRYGVIESFTSLRNDSDVPVEIEMLSSFSLTGITPFSLGDTPDALILHRVRSFWSAEGRLHSIPIEDLGLEPSWSGHGVRCLRFGQVGSMPVRNYFPIVFVEDRLNGVTWGGQVAHPASWQMEVSRRDDSLSLSGGLADREFGHWTKRVEPGATFITPTAYLTVVCGDVDDAAHRLTTVQARPLVSAPPSEQDLPVVFNEYCTSWGSPSSQSLFAIAERLKERDIRYLVIDAGWYNLEGGAWYNSLGDWQVNRTLFPEGLDEALDHIRSCGMIPGIWFEMEVCGDKATAFSMADHFLKRDGIPITVAKRRFWDFRDPFVVSYLQEKVIDFLINHGIGYLKLDYNDSLGIGCDGAESLGEGLRQQMAAVQAFIRQIQASVPNIVIENCASGGHRLEPSTLALTSMSSFSDAHECAEIPIIAANLHRVMLPRQSQIWAVLRKSDSPQRLVYSLANTMLGRMCLSGDIHDLNEEQWRIVDQGMHFYKQVASVIREGKTRRYGTAIRSYRHPQGWQGIVRYADNGTQVLVIIHRFAATSSEWMEVPISEADRYDIAEVFADGSPDIQRGHDQLSCRLDEDFSAVCILLQQR